MTSPSKNALIAGGIFAIAAIVLSAVSWALAIRYSLPLPAALPILNIALPLTLPFLVPLMTRMGGRARKGVREILHPYAWYFTTLIPLMILVVAAVDGTPSDMVQCNMENRWKQMFRSKNEASVRAIQNALRCCGYNSLHDRAWPFPSHDIDAQACERTQGSPKLDFAGRPSLSAQRMHWFLIDSKANHSQWGSVNVPYLHDLE
ncbi:hypothetical protein RBB50_003439 [Rhinocladiella similis]